MTIALGQYFSILARTMSMPSGDAVSILLITTTSPGEGLFRRDGSLSRGRDGAGPQSNIQIGFIKGEIIIAAVPDDNIGFLFRL